MSWAVATLQPQGERRATDNLERQGYQSYSPRFYDPHHRRAAPLFPGYLLILIKEQWQSITGTRGIASLIMRGIVPNLIPDHLIAPFREATDSDGLVVLSRLPGAPGAGTTHRFRMEQKVRVQNRRSVWDGRIVIYDGMSSADRCYVLLSFMGRKVRAQVPEMDLSPL